MSYDGGRPPERGLRELLARIRLGRPCVCALWEHWRGQTTWGQTERRGLSRA